MATPTRRGREGGRRSLRRARTDGDGVVAELDELVGCRPDRRLGGFAPGGKVTTHVAGQAASPFRGRGMEFDESRVYRPGDDVRAIDWRVTARTGEVHTKLFREERERPVFVLLDLRESMAFGTRVRFKSVLAARITAMLSWIALDGGDRLGGFLLGPHGVESLPTTRTRHGLLTWLHVVSEGTRSTVEPSGHRGVAAASDGSTDDGASDAEPGGTAERTSLSRALRQLRRVCRPGALVFVISDFEDLDDIAEAELARLTLHAHVTTVLVHDPLEEALPVRAGLSVGDGRRALRLEQLGAADRARHASWLAERRACLTALARRRRMTYLDLATSDDPGSVLRPPSPSGRRRASA